MSGWNRDAALSRLMRRMRRSEREADILRAVIRELPKSETMANLEHVIVKETLRTARLHFRVPERSYVGPILEALPSAGLDRARFNRGHWTIWPKLFKGRTTDVVSMRDELVPFTYKMSQVYKSPARHIVWYPAKLGEMHVNVDIEIETDRAGFKLVEADMADLWMWTPNDYTPCGCKRGHFNNWHPVRGGEDARIEIFWEWSSISDELRADPVGLAWAMLEVQREAVARLQGGEE